MIRKMLVIAAAVAMPATAMAAVTTVGASGVAGAAAKVYTSTSCAVTGTVTFAAPGLSHDGSLGKKATVSSTSAVTPGTIVSGTGGCGTTTVKSKITTAATDCLTAPAPLPAVCASATTKLHYAYSNASNLASAGVSSIVASLSKGLKIADNGNKVVGTVTLAGTTSVVGGACGAGNIGFQIAGSTNVTGLSYTLLLCLVGDTGPGTSGAFGTDYLAAAGGNTSITIATAVVSGNSALTFVKV